MAATVYRIVLTGGPGAGKTTALSYLYDKLSALGFRVYKVPEVARTVLGAGISHLDFTDDLPLQAALLQGQVNIESTFNGLAKAYQSRLPEEDTSKIVLLFDRGRMDVKAFSSSKTWQTILHEQHLSEVDLRDEPYDGIIHMVTAAIGAEDAYVNDDVRKETPAQSRDLDGKIRDAWTGHPHLIIVGNKDDGLDGKMKRTLSAVLRIVGYPVPVETERKYLVKKVDYHRAAGVKFETVDIWQAYLQGEQRIRKRGQDGRYVYTLTEKKPYGRNGFQRMEIERQLSIREFNTLLEYRDFNLMPIEKRRKCFVWEGQYFELDEFVGNHQGLVMLEVELASPGQVVYLPPWIEIEHEVTPDEGWKNRSLAASLCAGPNGWRNVGAP